jgi:hypothetical protein
MRCMMPPHTCAVCSVQLVSGSEGTCTTHTRDAHRHPTQSARVRSVKRATETVAAEQLQLLHPPEASASITTSFSMVAVCVQDRRLLPLAVLETATRFCGNGAGQGSAWAQYVSAVEIRRRVPRSTPLCGLGRG